MPQLARATTLLLALAACSDTDGAPRRVALTSERVSLEVEAARDPLEAGMHSIDWLEQGLAGLSLGLLFDDAERIPFGDRHAWRWKLPRPAARHVPSLRHAPAVSGVGLAEIVPWTVGERPPERSFWVRGNELFVTLGPGANVPARLRLVYPILAAYLVGSELAGGRDAGELCRTRSERNGTAFDALAIAAGVRLRAVLPSGSRWRLDAELLPESTGGSAEPPVVRVWMDGALALERMLPPEGTPLPPPGRGATRLSIELLGPTGSAVLLRAPALVDVSHVAAQRPPNLLLIVVDSLRADRLAAWGSTRELTPSLDRLVSRALSFRQCWATSSASLPSLASMLTSTHAERHRAARDGDRLGEGLRTLGEVLGQAGYQTMAITDGGFASPAYGVDRGFAEFHVRGGGVERVALAARALIERAGAGPWFLLAHTQQLRAPYEPPPAARFVVLSRHPGWPEGRAFDPAAFAELAAAGARFPVELSSTLAELYDEDVRRTDRALGEMLGALSTALQLDRTVVCFVSTHGEEFGEHGLGGHGDTLYAEQLHVPLAIAWPDGHRAGEQDGRPVSLVDLAPTLLDALGLGDRSASAGVFGDRAAHTGFAGVSLLGAEHPSAVYAARLREDVGPLRALRRGEWTAISGEYVYAASRGAPSARELYQLEQDPLQQKNRAAVADHDVVESLFGELRELSAREAEAAEPGDTVAPDVARRFGVPLADRTAGERPSTPRAPPPAPDR